MLSSCGCSRVSVHVFVCVFHVAVLFLVVSGGGGRALAVVVMLVNRLSFLQLLLLLLRTVLGLLQHSLLPPRRWGMPVAQSPTSSFAAVLAEVKGSDLIGRR